MYKASSPAHNAPLNYLATYLVFHLPNIVTRSKSILSFIMRNILTVALTTLLVPFATPAPAPQGSVGDLLSGLGTQLLSCVGGLALQITSRT